MSIEVAMAVVIRPYSTSLAFMISKTIYKTPTPNKADNEKLMMTPMLMIKRIIFVSLTIRMPSFKSVTNEFRSILTGFLLSFGISMVISLNADMIKLTALTINRTWMPKKAYNAEAITGEAMFEKLETMALMRLASSNFSFGNMLGTTAAIEHPKKISVISNKTTNT